MQWIITANTPEGTRDAIVDAIKEIAKRKKSQAYITNLKREQLKIGAQVEALEHIAEFIADFRLVRRMSADGCSPELIAAAIEAAELHAEAARPMVDEAAERRSKATWTTPPRSRLRKRRIAPKD